MMNQHRVSSTCHWHRDRNLLLSGYLRETSEMVHVIVPDHARLLIHQYAKKNTASVLGTATSSTSSTSTSTSTFTSISSSASSPKSQTSQFQSAQKCQKLGLVSDVYRRAMQSEFGDTVGSICNAANNELCHLDQDSDDYHSLCNFASVIATFLNSNILNQMNTIMDIQSGGNHLLFLTSTGFVFSCGANDSGQCGLADNKESAHSYILQPQRVVFLQDKRTKIKAIAAGKLHSMFIDDEDRLLVCGFNYCGQLGLKTEDTPDWLTDELLDELMERPLDDSDASMGFLQLAPSDGPGPFAGFMADSDDEDEEPLNNANMKSNEDALCVFEPTLNREFSDSEIKCKSISCGSFHSMVISQNGECFTFGHNAYGNLGNEKEYQYGQGESKPYKLPIADKIIQGECGYEHSMVLTANHEIFVFGDNSSQQCSRVCSEEMIKIPRKLSKSLELGIDENCYIEAVRCCQNQSFVIYDPHDRL